MKLRNPRSIIVISAYLVLNGFIIFISLNLKVPDQLPNQVATSMAPEFTEIEELNYFHMKKGLPEMSLAAVKMKSQGEETAEFETPRGIYHLKEKNKAINYTADVGHYLKLNEVLTLNGGVKVTSNEAEYSADKIKYFFKKDLILGTGNIKFEGDDLKSKDHLTIRSDSMRSNPDAQLSRFSGNVAGSMQRKKKYEGRLTFSSDELFFEGPKSLAHLEGNVLMKRSNYKITSGKADMYLENFNKSLKYFVLNDDVKVSEKLQTPEGMQERKAYAERLEGFGREQKMVLSGAPRVEMGKDVIKGYRITIRENVDLIEVDDAMSDVQVKREKKLKE